MIGFSQQELRFWPILGEGMWAIFLKSVDLDVYHENSTWCKLQTAEFIIKVWDGLPEMHELESTPLNRALPWAQGTRELATTYICSNCGRNALHPVEGDKKCKLYFSTAGQYTVDNLVCVNCYQYPYYAKVPRPPASETQRVFKIQNPKPECCEGKDCQSTKPTDRIQSFCLDNVWTWLCGQCRSAALRRNPDKTCDGCGVSCVTRNISEDGIRRLCFMCRNQEIGKGPGRPPPVITPTVPRNQKPGYPMPKDLVCENTTCKTIGEPHGKNKLAPSFGRWVCKTCYACERSSGMFRVVGPTGRAYYKPKEKKQKTT
jgi:hypothetical protein